MRSYTQIRTVVVGVSAKHKIPVAYGSDPLVWQGRQAPVAEGDPPLGPAGKNNFGKRYVTVTNRYPPALGATILWLAGSIKR